MYIHIEGKTRTQVCLYPPHTHTHTPTSSRWTPGPSPETVQPHWALCAFTGPVRDTPTIPLVSLCVHRDALTIPLGSLCVHRDALADKLPVKMPRATFPPILSSKFHTIYLHPQFFTDSRVEPARLCFFLKFGFSRLNPICF